MTELRLPFLGERTYLQGTTLFDALQPFVPRGARQSFKASRLITSDRVAVAEPDALPEAPWATLRWPGGGVGVVPLEPSPEIARQPYDERLVTDRARIGVGAAELEGEPPFSFCATIVSLQKALLLRELRSGGGQWLFVRLDVERVPASPRRLAVRRELTLGTGLVRSAVEADGARLGVLYFSWLARP